MAWSKKSALFQRILRVLPVWRTTASRKDSRRTFLRSILNYAAGQSLSLRRTSFYDLLRRGLGRVVSFCKDERLITLSLPGPISSRPYIDEFRL
jgi:hypothetical protein